MMGKRLSGRRTRDARPVRRRGGHNAVPVNFHPPSSRTILNPADAGAGFDLGGLQERWECPEV